MLGIAGGVPNPTNPAQHVRLGDVVVSDRYGVIQYDFIKQEHDEIIIRSRPAPPAAQLLDAVAALATEVAAGRRPWVQYLSRTPDLEIYGRPDTSTDVLFKTSDPECAIEHPIDPDRREGEPRVFHGPIASSNSLLKNPVLRDELRDRCEVKAVEMESSGIADATWERGAGYLAIRGICDYCDQSKGDAWQNYAALAAGAYLRALLAFLPPLA
jgi:nucleoside phosphorylase